LYFTKKETYLLTIQKQWKNYLLTANPLLPFIPKRRNNRRNEQAFREQYGEDVPASIIQLLEVPKAVTKLQNVRLIWLKHNARLHILHLTTEAETHLFQNDIPLQEKKITTEVSASSLVFRQRL
jgi:dihydroorotase